MAADPVAPDNAVSGAILLTLSYDGTDFAGWARQPGQRTIQGSVEDAITKMNGSFTVLRGASRTDSGVHALGQLAAFDPAREIPPAGWLLGINRELPDDLVVRAAERAPLGYDPRYDTFNKLYRYLVMVDGIRDPVLRHRVWFLGTRERGKALLPLDVPAMRKAAALFCGTHDFRAFRSADDERTNTMRTILSFEVIEGYWGDPRLIALEVRGTAFMKNMVRILSGTLVEVGKRKRTPESVLDLLGPDVDRQENGPTAPSCGLTLIDIQRGRVAAERPGWNWGSRRDAQTLEDG